LRPIICVTEWNGVVQFAWKSYTHKKWWASWARDKLILTYLYHKINRKFHVATEIGSTFIWFSTIYWGSWNRAKWLFIISMKFPIDRIPSCFIFEFRDFGRIMAVGHWTKSQNWGSRVFHHHHVISDPKSIIMPYIENLELWPDWGVGHRRRWPWVQCKKHFWCWDLSKEPSHVQFW
jgi:hypothetical protein